MAGVFQTVIGTLDLYLRKVVGLNEG